tara:strand:+ start:322 stop:801 length:480 start_codon:yes stop_codon:yes gene_type:complete
MNRLIRGLQLNLANSNILANSNSLANGNSLANSNTILKAYNSFDWKSYIKFDKDNYKKNLIYRNMDFEIFLVCWLPLQKTKIHNHSENGCLIRILEGEMNEIIYEPKNKEIITTNNMYQNDIQYIDDKIGVHKMINTSDKNCISLHIYSPPNFKATFFD